MTNKGWEINKERGLGRHEPGALRQMRAESGGQARAHFHQCRRATAPPKVGLIRLPSMLLVFDRRTRESPPNRA